MTIRPSSAHLRLLLVAVPALLAGCFGSRRQSATVPVRGDSVVTVAKADSVKDSVKAPVVEPPKTALDSTALIARADSLAKANLAGKPVSDSVARKDSTKGPGKKAAAETSMERLVMPAWHLQVASLRDSSTADQLGRRLATLGQVSFHVDRTRGDEIPWFAVYLGPYGTRAEAESAKVELGALDRHVAQAIVRPPTTR